MTPLLTLEQAAEYLGRTPQWLAGAARQRTVPGRKVGRTWRFTEDDLSSYLDSVRTGGESARVTRRRRAS